MFGSLLEMGDEGEYLRDTSGPNFAANFDITTEMENTNLRPEEPRIYLLRYLSTDRKIYYELFDEPNLFI